MAKKYELITELYRRTVEDLMGPQVWQRFLSTACHNFRLSFDEQVLLFAQRPDATAVLEISGKRGWNQRFGRWVNRGATGIAVFDGEYQGRARLKYYFDIADTHESNFARPVPIWTVRPEFDAAIIETLGNSFGELEDTSDLAAALLSAAKNAVEDNLPDYLDRLKYYKENSSLEELDDQNIEVHYRRAVEASVGYMLLARCGIDPEQYFSDDDFRCVAEFNTPNTLNALGLATGDIAQMCLTEISRTVLPLQRQMEKENRTFAYQPKREYPKTTEQPHITERRDEHEQSDLYDEGRLPAAGPSAAPGAGGPDPWEVRPVAPEVSEGEPAGGLYEPTDLREAEPPSDGGGENSHREDGAPDGGDGEGPGRDGGTEGQGPDGMGGPDEQYPGLGGGNRAGGADLRLTTEEAQEDAGSLELPAFFDEKLILAIISNKEDDLKYKKQQIELFFSLHPDEAERAEYLKTAYQDRYTELLVDNVRVGYKPQEDGLLVWEGAYLTRSKEAVLSWGLVAALVGQQIEKREYYINTNIKAPPPQDLQQLSLFDLGGIEQSSQGMEADAPLIPRPRLSQQVVDTALCIEANHRNSRLIICAYFMKDHPAEENARFLAQHYGRDGAGFYLGNQQYSIWYDDEGVRLSGGKSAKRSDAMLITWEQAAQRIRELLDLGRYAPQDELDRAPRYERDQLSDRLLEIYRDVDSSYRERLLPSLKDVCDTRGGFPEMVAILQEKLTQPEFLKKLTEEYKALLATLEQEPYIMRFRSYNKNQVLKSLEDLQREPITFTAAGDFAPHINAFISNDEIDKIIRIGPVEYRLSVYSQYCRNPDKKEFVTYLKKYHGEYSGFGSDNINLSYTHKCLSYCRGDLTAPYAKADLAWSEVAKRITALIQQGKFLSDEDRAAIPAFERRYVAKAVYSFFSEISEDTPCPFPRSFVFWDGVKYLEQQLTDPVKVDEIYQTMLPVWEATPLDGSYISQQRRKGLGCLSAYREGTFSLFGEKKEAKPLTLPDNASREAIPISGSKEAPEEEKATEGKATSQTLSPWDGYRDTQNDHPDSIILYQVGDFFEVMGANAAGVADILSLTSTIRAIGEGHRIAMCGVPAHTLDQYVKRLCGEGYDVIVVRMRGNERMLSSFPAPDMAKAQRLINDFCEREYDHPADFQDLQNIGIAYSTVTDAELEIQVTANLVGFSIDRYVFGDLIERRQYASLAELISGELANLDSDELVSLSRNELEKVVDDRFSVIETEKGYTLWDEVMGAAYVDEMGVSEEFTSRWQAEDYREKVIVATIAKEYVAAPAPEDIQPSASITAGPFPEPDKGASAEEEQPTTLAPPKPKRERVVFSALYPEVPLEQRHDFHIQDPRLGYGTPGEKFTRNTSVIRTLKQIEYEDRLATPEEQAILSGYVGWGGLADCFDEQHSHYQELKHLLDPEEYAAARASTLTAFYTSPTIIQAIYQALAQMGFQRGNILEPACGVGNFIGMLPESMAESKVYGVELDSISGRIAQQLYQTASIAVNSFESVQMPDSFFDVAIGNVPFGDFKVRDKRYDKNNWLIHDYFFGKTLDKVRPGGIIAFITSKGTMDKENPAVRKYLAQRADFIGAIRLPETAFKNAGTEVTSDIIFLQKRDRMTDIEPDWVHLDTDENGIRMNSYFVQHPEMVLGEMVMESTRFGMDSVCKPYEDTDLGQQLQEAIQNLHAEISEYQVEELDEEDNSIPADPAVRNFSYTIVDGKIYFRENSLMHPVEVSVTAENRIRGMIALRDCTRKLIEYQTEGYPDTDIEKEQSRLNALYDNYTKKYGLLSSRGNSLAFGEDSSYFLLCSLEVLDEEGNLKRKADMFTKRTIRPHKAVTSVDTASEALAVSIAEKAKVDMEYMSELSGKSQEELASELEGVIFRNITCAENPEDIPAAYVEVDFFPFVSADEYLSGNVRHKLRMAKALYEVLPAEEKRLITKNIEALEAVQPVDLTAAEIGVRIGANWVPVEIYQQFMEELFGTSAYARNRIKILRSQASGQWAITDKNADRGNIKVITTYGSQRMTAYHILEQTLNQKDVRVFDYVEDKHGNKQPVLNKKETAIAQDRQELIKSKFAEWLWKDIDRRERLCGIYNETFNSIRPREYDGQHITFYGMNPEITLRKHQIDAIAHIMYGGNTLLAHEVGAGKTFEMVAAAMEMKRLGLCTKSLVVVPNHITEQWAAEWLQLYPSANILVATKRDFETKNRKKFCGRIATGDYDAIIIGHSQFEKIPMSAERQRLILEDQINQTMLSIQEAKEAKAERYTVKQLEKTRKSLEAKLAKLNDQSRKDDLVTFEELGVDRIFVDESHYFKNLFLTTKMRNVGGIAQTEAQKSSDLFMKCRYLDEITGGRGVIFATGTPISNSMVELYTIQRYLQYSTLEEMGLTFFDDWGSDFGETITAIELSPEGTGYRAKTRFAKFFNLPELMSTFKQIADIQTADMLKLPVPKANFHTEVLKPSELQQKMIKGLAERAEKIRNREVDPSIDNMLKITNDGRKLALDMRLMNSLAADDPNGKVALCARNVHQIWENTKEQRSAQLVFCDLSTPKGDGTFNVYDDLKKKLTEAGIPEEEIAFIHEANTEVKKKELFARVRSGQVRILMGSTQKMGAGTNVQDRLIALHDLDCPWRPSDLAQRLGRIVRQGNENPEVEIFRYVTEGTFDAYLYQLVENKQKFIAQIMTSKAPVRIADDVDETALSYSEIKALATGNPLIIEKCNLDMEVGKLNMLKANYLSQKYGLEELVLRKYPAEIQRLTERIAGYEQDVALAAAHPKPQEGFVGIEINGTAYTDKEAAGKAILDVCTKMTGSDAVPLGQYRGFSLTLAYDGVQNEYRVTLKGTLSHTAVLGADVLGNLTRMDNKLGGLDEQLANTQRELAENRVQLENAKLELATPFAKEMELAEKEARLKELNILLNMDQKDHALLDCPDEETLDPERVSTGRYR